MLFGRGAESEALTVSTRSVVVARVSKKEPPVQVQSKGKALQWLGSSCTETARGSI